MEKVDFLESLLKNAEEIDSHSGYTDDANFVFSFAALKINPPDDEVYSEYELYKNSNFVTYKRIHAYIEDNNSEKILYLFKNSVPDRVKFISNGGDRDLLSERLKTNLIYTIDLYDKAHSYSEENFFRYHRILLNDKTNSDDIDINREYIIENVRVNRDKKTVCWHIYPFSREGRMLLYILEHSNPKNKKVVNFAEDNINANTHYLPVEMGKADWNKYIKS